MTAFLDDHRVNMHRHYFRICSAQKRDYDGCTAELLELRSTPMSDDDLESVLEKEQQCYERREQAAVIGITFAGMCLEAFFYDYAAAKLGDAFVLDHLDKLDLPSKLIVIPRLVCGKGIEKSSHVYGRVKTLSKDRNYLVHFKSKRFPLAEIGKASEFHDDLNQMLNEALTNGVESIGLVMEALDDLHGHAAYYRSMVCG